jgi:nucleotide-binding universal stress UspA family protein
MFKNILVPLDGSQMAESVLLPVSYIAEELHSEITLVHILEKNPPHKIHGQRHIADESQAEEYLHGIVRRVFSDSTRVHIHVHNIAETDLASSIASHINELASDLLVMCSHGKHLTRNLIYGNLAQQVIAHGRVPLLLFPTESDWKNKQLIFQSLLVPLDGNSEHEQGLRVALDIAREYKATLQLLYVVPTYGALSGPWTATRRLLPGTTSRLLDEQTVDADKYLKHKMDELRKEKVPVSGLVKRGNPAKVISRHAKKSNTDLIVLATHGIAGLSAFWAGSVTPRICRKCRVPMMFVPLKKS